MKTAQTPLSDDPRHTPHAKGTKQQPSKTNATMRVPERWSRHYWALSRLRDRLLAESNEALRAAAEPLERHSMHLADPATDEFDHNLAQSRLAAEQDALYEVESAMKRITDGTYSICEQSRIPPQRLKAIPWTRFVADVAKHIESVGEIPRPASRTTVLGAIGYAGLNEIAFLFTND